MMFTKGERICHNFQGKEEFIFQYYDHLNNVVVVNEDGATLKFSKDEMYSARDALWLDELNRLSLDLLEDIEIPNSPNEHECIQSEVPMSVAEKKFQQWYYCTDCGDLMERFNK